ncbi:MAG: hypothetical protein AMDU1_APLC00044G0045 [Thermoplasmatales archaeon A-plasma]|jgi:hypothetical protein|nr:MAG: hypothetical protein AMDU1_APLC00044G0045 [Thermoplasmatales archaeon A-plasma]MCL4331063.1 hypothetical protein [Candidatus Thermoplasmatota archaeon]WMT45294.1 MAG: DUF6015 family protein [Cuniculiplasma divulgatum]
MAVMTREILISALEKTYGKKGMARKDVEELCDFVLSFFGYEDYVLDNVLSAPERDVFYNLEEFGFLETFREEVNIMKGRSWRVNQWKFKKDNIYRIANSQEVEKPEENIYDEIFRELEN